MYRHALLAADSQNEALRARLVRIEADLARARREHERALLELERVRDGVDPRTSPLDEPRFRWMRRSVQLLGVGDAAAGWALVRAAAARWLPDLLPSPWGLRNLAWSLEHGHVAPGLLATALVASICLPWIALPLLASYGLARGRRWGYLLAVAVSGLSLLTPMLPVAAFALFVLSSRRVRATFTDDGDPGGHLRESAPRAA
jgi:hypothetical protein